MKSRSERAAERRHEQGAEPRKATPEQQARAKRKEKALAKIAAEGRAEIVCGSAYEADRLQSDLMNAINRRPTGYRVRSKRSKPTGSGRIKLTVYREDVAAPSPQGDSR